MRIGSLLSPARQSRICEPRRRLAWKTQTYQILPKRIAVVFVRVWCRGVACARALRRQFYVGVLSPKMSPKEMLNHYQIFRLGYQTTKRRKEGKEYKARRRRSVDRIGLIKRFASSRYTCACRSSLFIHSSLPFLSLLSIQRVRQRGLFDVPFRFVRFVEPVFRHLEFPREHVQLHR